MNDIQIFNHPQFGQIRTAGTADEPMFCLADVCNAIGITNARNVKARLDEEDVRLMDTLTAGGIQQITFVTESGLYDVILRSDSENAKPFRKWVTGDILPSIRKTGSYSIRQMSRKELALMVIQAEEENERLMLENKQQQEQLDEQKPKVEHYDLFMNAEHGDKDVSVRKFIQQAGIIGERLFWSWMEFDKKMIYRGRNKKPEPYAGKYRHIFVNSDAYNPKNDWSGNQLMICADAKVELAKMYYEDHPDRFYESKRTELLKIWQ